jgi:hypothetical protein
MKHLSSEQISSVVAGAGVSEEGHLLLCASCALEVERVRGVLLLFRSSVREWTDRLDHSEFPISEFPVNDAIVSRARFSNGPHRAPLAWVLAAATFAAAVALPIYEDSKNREDRELKAQTERDEQLLEDVNAQLSRSGPVAMDPLMQLMSFPNSAAGAQGIDPAKSYGIKTNAGTSR